MKAVSAQQLDVMNEIGNIGAGHAATALSLLMGRKVEMTVPETVFLTLEEGCAELSRDDEVGVGIEVGLGGAINGLTLLTVDEDSARHLMEAFGDMLSGQGLDDAMAQSALMEIGNIVTGSFLTAITEFLGEPAWVLPPRFMHDYFDAFVCNVIVAGCRNVDWVLVFKTEFKVDDRCIFGDLAYLPSPEAFELIMKKFVSAGG